MARSKRVDRVKAERAVRALLEAFGLDPRDPALEETPQRVVKAWSEQLLDGYGKDPRRAIGTAYPTDSPAAVVASRIPFHSMCPHHLLPLTGEAHIAYAPDGEVPGFGRLAALIDVLAHRLVLQEELAQAIADALHARLSLVAVAVVLEAKHGCVGAVDFARRDTLFRTTALAGDPARAAALVAEIDASLRRNHATDGDLVPRTDR